MGKLSNAASHYEAARALHPLDVKIAHRCCAISYAHTFVALLVGPYRINSPVKPRKLKVPGLPNPLLG